MDFDLRLLIHVVNCRLLHIKDPQILLGKMDSKYEKPNNQML